MTANNKSVPVPPPPRVFTEADAQDIPSASGAAGIVRDRGFNYIRRRSATADTAAF